MLNNDKADRGMVLRKAAIALPDISPEELEDWVDRAELYFFARTGRRAVPVRALLLWVDITVALAKQAAAEMGGGRVSSIKRGDTAVQFAEHGTTLGNSLERRIDYYKAVRTR